ncbi:DNA-directed RNA polymerase subunit L [Candidatus Woesearchaeota archaeon]|nr:DNA-directed RNA polymerase subunit L [Candidatus Woesearchaeota archaeon]
MEIKVLEHNKRRLVFELIGADHTLCNSLKKELWTDSSVRAAAYAIAHPLIGIPKFIVETNGQKDADEVVKAAVKRLKKHNRDFLDAFKEAKKKAK